MPIYRQVSELSELSRVEQIWSHCALETILTFEMSTVPDGGE